jgi:hypothetical protein
MIMFRGAGIQIQWCHQRAEISAKHERPSEADLEGTSLPVVAALSTLAQLKLVDARHRSFCS